MTPIEQSPIDALSAPLPLSYRERARRRRTPLAFIIFGSAMLHIFFLGFIMAHQPTSPPKEKLIEIDLRDPKPIKQISAVKPKPLKVIERIPLESAHPKLLPKPKIEVAPVVKRPKTVPVKLEPKIINTEKPIQKPPSVKPLLPNSLLKPLPATNPTKPNPASPAIVEPPREVRNKALSPQMPKSLHAGALPKPSSGAGESKRPLRDDEAAPAPGLPGAGRVAKAINTRQAHDPSPFDELNAKQPITGGMTNSGQQTPLPRGERARRLASTGSAFSDPAFNHSSAGSDSAGVPAANSGQGALRNRNNDLAGANDAGKIHTPQRMANAGGRPRPNSNIMAYIDSTGRDHDRVSVAPGAFGPGNSGGSGAGNRHGAGTTNNNGGFSRSPLNVRTGSGDGGGIGGNPRRGRSGDEAANGSGGAGDGRGIGLGVNIGQGGAPRGPRAAGNLFGDANGSKKGGDRHGGGGSGGGPGKSIQPAQRDESGTGGSGQTGRGNGPSFGRGGIGGGTGAGTGIKGKGAGGKGDGRGNTVDENAGDKGVGGRGRPGMVTADRKHEGGSIIGRGVWGSWMMKFYQDKSDHPDQANDSFGQGHAIDWPVFTDLKATKSDKTLKFDWGTKPPAAGMNDTYWSARITGKIFVPKDDDYWFYFDQLDDAGRLVLDGKQVIKVWKVQKSTPDSGKIHLTRGEHDILIEYVQGPGTGASLTLSWKSSSFPKEIVGTYKPGE